MQSAAEPGTVLIADNTYRLAVPFFEFEDRGQLVVKGKSEPVQVYRVIAEQAGAIQTRGIAGLHSPLVGREMELHTLQGVLSELRQGRGQIVSVMAEAGLGKSRLVAEWRKAALPVNGEYAPVQWLEGRSLSYETTTPYAPFVDMFSDLFGVRMLQDNIEKYAHIKTAIAESAPQRASDIAPFIARVMDIQPTGEDAERVRYLEAPNLRGKVFQAVSEWIGALVARGPLVLIFEDLHWADPTSLDLIDALMPMTDSAPLMILALFRPRRNEPSWRFHETASRDYGHRYISVALNPLDAGQSRQLVANLLEIEDLPERVRALILAKAEGNPYFVEEVIRSLLDAGLVILESGHWRATRAIETIAVPDSLSSVIGARLDRLDDGSKRAAQTAAVIGRQFEFDILANVSQALPALASAKLDEAMGTLQRRELVREKSRIPSRAYAFKHVLVQETAYASLLLSRRRELHLRVAECLEHAAPDQVHEIGRHFLEARAQARALPYLIEAADRAARAYSTPEATQYYRQALDALKANDDTRLARRAYEASGPF